MRPVRTLAIVWHHSRGRTAIPRSPGIPVEFEPPEIARFRAGNSGVDYVTVLRGDRPGPAVQINALTHGNEICGAAALAFLTDAGIRPTRGRLILSFANVAAYGSFDAERPLAARYVDRDLNRVWSAEVLEGPDSDAELDRARALRPVIDGADYLLDLHSMELPAPPLVLAGTTEKALGLARAIGFPALVVRDSGHALGRRLIDYGAFSDPASARTALLIECGQHGLERSAEVAIEMAFRFLGALDMLDRETLARHLPEAPPPPQRLVEITDAVTIEHGDFQYEIPVTGVDVIARAGTLIGRDGERDVRTPYDGCVVLTPILQSARGLTAFRLGHFVD